MIEHERAYMFTWDGITDFLESRGLGLEWEGLSGIEDHYIRQGLRVRHRQFEFDDVDTDPVADQWILVRKTGNKAEGHRFEEESVVDPVVGKMIADEAQFKVIKSRRRVIGLKTERPYNITVDFVDSPMKVACLEVEALEPIAMPIPADISRRLFGVDLRECPLCTWDYFNRKIGICGAPSCGKTETAKWLSYVLNTKFNGNAYHVSEYATTFIQKYRRKPEFDDQILMLYGQRKREKDAETANIVVSDCPTFLNFIYAQILYSGPFNEKSALKLAKIYKEVLFDIKSYSDITMLKLQDYAKNNIRYQTADESLEIEKRILRFLDDHHIPYRSATYNDANNILSDLLYLNEV